MKKKIAVKDIFFLQAVIVIFTISSVIAKFASGSDFMSAKFFLFYGLEILVLGIYAILWQQVIKKFELSIAYANKAMGLLWTLVWAVVIFKNKITFNNILGVIIVIAGIIILNSDQVKTVKTKAEA